MEYDWAAGEANKLFRLLVQDNNKQLYSFQQRIGKTLWQGKNMVVNAPTGSGKTWAAILPYLLAKKHNKPLADRLIYVLPLRTLASQLKEVTAAACDNAGLGINVTIQTGSEPYDRFWQGDIIFMTIDQLLASYLHIPGSGSRLANINAGALIGSLIVFDEIHLLDPGRSMATVYEMINRLKDYTQFMLMTATLSLDTVHGLAQLVGAEAIIPSGTELAEIPSQSNKVRTFYWEPNSLNSDMVKQYYYKNTRCLVICNTVNKAQKISTELKELLPGIKILLLHNRFLVSDRKQIESLLRLFFREFPNGIIVATQVVEAGIDISCDVLLTEVCPANSLIQRAGRCARYAGETGKVIVFDLEKGETGKYRYGPYKDVADEVDKTAEVVKEFHGKNVDITLERQMLTLVHSHGELQMLRNLRNRWRFVKQLVEQTMAVGEGANREELIRDIDSISVFVSLKPENLDFSQPFETISVPRASLYAFFQNVEKKADWVAKVPISYTVDDNDIVPITWQVIQEGKQASGAWLVVISPQYASYHPEIGLILGEPGEEAINRPVFKLKSKVRGYQAETLLEHSLDVGREINLLQCTNSVALDRICNNFGCTQQELERMLELTAVLHDAGKSSRKWQKAAREWQQLIDPQCPLLNSDDLFAHTTYIPEKHEQIRRIGDLDPGPHAIEGAYEVCDFVCDFLEKSRLDISLYAPVILTAIARHHGSFTRNLSYFELTKSSQTFFAQIADRLYYHNKFVLQDKPDADDQTSFGENLINPTRKEDERLLPLYWFFIRNLRLADQNSQIKKGGILWR